MRAPTILALCLAAGCMEVPPATSPPPAQVTPPPSASTAPPAPLPAVQLRWNIEEDFVHGAASQLPPRPLDLALVGGLLPPPQRAPFAALANPGKNQEKEAEKLALKLEAVATKSREKKASSAAWLAVGWLVEVGKLSTEKETSLRWAERAYQSAADQAPVEEALGAEARYRLALALGKLRRGDQGKNALNELVSSKQDLQPEAAARLGALLERTGASPEESAAIYRRGLQSQIPATALIRGALVHGLMLSSYQQQKFQAALDEARDFLRGFRGVGPPSIIAEEALKIAADSLEYLGTEGLLAQNFAPEITEAFLRLAWRALRRGDNALAERLTSHVLENAPRSWNAPAALRLAITVAEQSKQGALADERRARLLRDFGPSSVWAEAQRNGRGKDGWPGDTAIAAASKPPPTLPEESKEAQVTGRLKALVRLCLEPHAWHPPTPGTPWKIQLQLATTASGEATLRARTEPADEVWSEMTRCLERLGPAHLRGSPASAEATAVWER